MSTMRSSAEILEQAARDGSIDISEWPRVLENVLQKLHDIVHNDFPLPHIARPAPAPAPTSAPSGDDSTLIAASSPPAPESSDPLPTLTQATDDATSEPQESLSQSSVTTNKENAPPPRPPVPSFNVNNTPNVPPPSTVQQSEPIADSPLPPDLLNSYQSSTNILRNAFATSPPYTIQRLAELVLNPRRNYRFLPPFLSALDRAVSVTSPVTDFPLPQFQRFSDGSSLSFLTNGSDVVNGITERGGLGSDESLGGALLTPIPWVKKREEDQSTALNTAPGSPAGVNTNGNQELRTETEETIDGPHGAGRIETVSVTTNRLGLPTTTTNSPSPNLSPSPTPSSSSTSSHPVHSSPTGDGQGQEAALAQDIALRSAGGVTQGELLRQEQEKGVVPLGLEVPRHPLLTCQAGGATAPTKPDGEGDDHPHARGPNIIGMEDTGPQAHGAGRIVLDMEAAAGRKSPGGAPSSPKFEALQPASIANVKTEEQGDPVLPEGNIGGVAETSNVAAAAGGKRKRDEAEEGEAKRDAGQQHVEQEAAQHTSEREANNKNEDEEMTDV